MRVNLKGIHRIKSRGRYYYYAWRGGPRIKGEPGTPEFVASYNAAHEKRKEVSLDTVGGLVKHYKASQEYKNLSPRTRKDYGPVFKVIEEAFADMPKAALTDKRARGIFKEWRGTFAKTPRKADRHWSVLKRIFNVAKDHGLIVDNPCDRGGRLYHGSRVSDLWTQDQITLAEARMPAHIWSAVVLAKETGQRQADLLQLLWSDIDSEHIRITQNKTGKRVSIRKSQELREMLSELKREQQRTDQLSTHVLLNTHGRPWTSDGFQTSWGKAKNKAGIIGVTFNDLRGTAVTTWAEAGATVPEIAALSGHSLKDVETILEKHYLSKTQALGDNVIMKLDKARKRTKV